MLSNLALFSSLLVAPVVLAVRPDLGTHLTRRSVDFQSRVNRRLEGNSDVSNIIDSKNWAGAVWAKGNKTFTYVTGTIIVPTLSGPNGSAISAWVGIDGDNCTNAILQTGLILDIENGAHVLPWYEWYPDYAQPFSKNISISAGDEVRLTVAAKTAISGVVILENISNGQFVAQSLNSPYPLSGGNAEWIVESVAQGGATAPITDFGTITFKDAGAGGTGGRYTPAGATIVELTQSNGTVMTDVSTDETSVTIRYV